MIRINENKFNLLRKPLNILIIAAATFFLGQTIIEMADALPVLMTINPTSGSTRGVEDVGVTISDQDFLSVQWKVIPTGPFGGECGVTMDGELHCRERYGLLTSLWDKGALEGLSIKKVADNGKCVVASDDQAYCWGYNPGDGTSYASRPVAVDRTGVLAGLTIENIYTPIISGNTPTRCVIASDGNAYCWGGKTGNGATPTSLTPVAVDRTGALLGLTVRRILPTSNIICLVASDDKLYCWGSDSYVIPANSDTPVATNMGSLTIKEITMDDYGKNVCIIAQDDYAYCWGSGENGRLGNGSLSSSSMPVAVKNSAVTDALYGLTINQIVMTDAVAVCVVASDENAYCWGYNNGQLGNGSTVQSSVPVKVKNDDALSGLQIISIERRHSYVVGSSGFTVIASDGNLYGWGVTSSGLQTTPKRLDMPLIGFPAVSMTRNFIEMSDGNTCFISQALDGCNKIAVIQTIELGASNHVNIEDYEYTETGVIIYATTQSHRAGAVDVIATNILGQSLVLPSGYTYTPYLTADSINPSRGLTTEEKQVTISGRGLFKGDPLWRNVESDGYRICAIDTTDKGYCVGRNDLPNSTNEPLSSYTVPVPMNVGPLENLGIAEFAIENSSMGCAIASNGKVYCWGGNNYGQLGSGSGPASHIPKEVDMTGVLNGLTAKQIATGFFHVCIVASDNNAYCWGRNYFSSSVYGALGDGTANHSSVPVAVYRYGVLSGKSIKQIAASADTTCAIASDNLPYCWGGDWGTLGNGTALNSSVPVAVDTSGVLNGLTAVQIAVGQGSACVIASNGKVYCWGANDQGDLGVGYGNSIHGPCITFYDNCTAVPVAVDWSGALSGLTAKQISSMAGYGYCIVASDNHTYCWGANWGGQIGIGTRIPDRIHSPAKVFRGGVLSGLTDLYVSLGEDSACVVASDHQIYCWGSNYGGGLANGTFDWDGSDWPVWSFPRFQLSAKLDGVEIEIDEYSVDGDYIKLTMPPHGVGTVNITITDGFDTTTIPYTYYEKEGVPDFEKPNNPDAPNTGTNNTTERIVTIIVLLITSLALLNIKILKKLFKTVAELR